MLISQFKISKEYKEIIKNEKLPIGQFSYEIYLGSDILFEKQDDTGLWNITVYKRLQGTSLERLMVISALASIKNKEKIWYDDETIVEDALSDFLEYESILKSSEWIVNEFVGWND